MNSLKDLCDVDEIMSSDTNCNMDEDMTETQRDDDHDMVSPLPKAPLFPTIAGGAGPGSYDGNGSALSSLSGGGGDVVATGTMPIINNNNNNINNSHSQDGRVTAAAPSLFKLGAPQILDEEDSDYDLEEEQLPSEPFLLESSTSDQLPEASFREVLEKSNRNEQLIDGGTPAVAAARRGSEARKPRRSLTEQDFFNNSLPTSNLNAHTGEWADASFSPTHNMPMKRVDGRGLTAALTRSSFKGAQIPEPGEGPHGNHYSTGTAIPRIPRSSFQGMQLPETGTGHAFHYRNEQAQGSDGHEKDPSLRPDRHRSKVLERMKQGLAQQGNWTLTDYHNVTRKGNKRSEELSEQEYEQLKKIFYLIAVIICILVMVVVTMVVVLLLREIVGDKNNSNDSALRGAANASTPLPVAPSPTPIPTTEPTFSLPTKTPTAAPVRDVPLNTLATVRKRGVLNCGIIEVVGLAYRNTSNGNDEWSGMDVDICRAIAAGIFGDPMLVNFLPVSTSTRFPTLNSEAVDVLLGGTTVTMERNVHEPISEVGFSFSAPYIYFGLGFAGDPSFVECAEALDTTTADLDSGKNCTELAICVVDSSTLRTVVQNLIPDVEIVGRSTFNDVYNSLGNGRCNVIASEQLQTVESIVRQVATGDFEYVVGTKIYSKEPVAIVTRQDDPNWSDFCQWILQSLFAAESRGINATTASSMPQTSAFGSDYVRSWIQAVSAIGNYGDIYERHLQPLIPRQGLNELNTAFSSGLMYSLPLGNPLTTGNVPGGTLEEVVNRGFLRCGVTRRPLLADLDASTFRWDGIEIKLCHMISAAIFNGIFSTVEYVNLPPGDLYGSLDRCDIDVIARLSPITIHRDVNAASAAFSFSPPLLYDALTFGGNNTYIQCANTLNWSTLTCQDLSICIEQGTIFEEQARLFYADRHLRLKASLNEAIEGLIVGECNVLAGGTIEVSEASVRQQGYTVSPYSRDVNRLPLSRVPMGMVTRQDDSKWSSFVFWIVNILIYAEENGITQKFSSLMPLTDVFGRLNFRIFRDAVAAAGSWGEVMKVVPREGLNQINSNPFGPQHYPLPGV